MPNSIILAAAHGLGLSGFKRLRGASPASVWFGTFRHQNFSRWLALCCNHRFGSGALYKSRPNMRFNPDGYAAG
jgi:hypothetical protein